jgi:hypothetical protein
MTGNKPNIFLFFPAAPILAATLLSLACSKHSGTPGATTRTYRMGFATSAPRPVLNEIVQSLNMWTTHADAAIISTEVPWDSLLNGENPVTYVMDNYGALLNIYRGKSMKVWVYIDPENGLNRQSDSDPLVALGLSIAQPAIQQVYRRFVVVMDSILQPDHLGLALETNLIRFAAPDSIYQGVKQAANAAAADVRAVDNKVPLSVSVQAEVAWGMLGGANTGYVGIATDLTDFPFLQEVGISSYPYITYSSPAAMPLSYYSQLVSGHSLPVFVSEGGWTSESLTFPQSIQSSPAQQQAYIRRQGQLLAQAKAIALFQLTFTDLSLSAWPVTDSAELTPFAFLGMVDSNFNPKPALTTWDSLRQQSLQAGN